MISLTRTLTTSLLLTSLTITLSAMELKRNPLTTTNFKVLQTTTHKTVTYKMLPLEQINYPNQICTAIKNRDLEWLRKTLEDAFTHLNSNELEALFSYNSKAAHGQFFCSLTKDPRLIMIMCSYALRLAIITHNIENAEILIDAMIDIIAFVNYPTSNDVYTLAQIEQIITLARHNKDLRFPIYEFGLYFSIFNSNKKNDVNCIKSLLATIEKNIASDDYSDFIDYIIKNGQPFDIASDENKAIVVQIIVGDFFKVCKYQILENLHKGNNEQARKIISTLIDLISQWHIGIKTPKIID